MLFVGLVLCFLLAAVSGRPMLAKTSNSFGHQLLVRTTKTGTILVSLASTGTTVGYLSRKVTGQGNYAITNTPSDYLVVTISTLPGPNDMIAQNSITGFPAVGGVIGLDATADITDGPNDAILAGTVQTPPGVTPQVIGNDRGQGGSSLSDTLSFAVESSIWFFDSNTNRITAQWVPGEPGWDGGAEPPPTSRRLNIRFATWENGVTMIEAEEFDAFKATWESTPRHNIGEPPYVVNEVFLSLV